MEPVPIRPSDMPPNEAELTLRKVYASHATKEEYERAEKIIRRVVNVLVDGACENEAWLKRQLRRIGLGWIATYFLMKALKRLCK